MEQQMPIFDLSLCATTTTKLSFLLFLLCTFNYIYAERDFNFKDSQVPLLEAKDEPHHGQDPYVLELAQCQHADSEIILSLILKNHDWNDLSDNKKTKLHDKLSKFFAIPKEFIAMDSITKHEMYAMQKESMRRGNNKSHFNNKYLGRVSFKIGCDTAFFKVGRPISKQISRQIKDGSLDNITDEKFGWWIIWRKQLKSRSHRNRRQVEGSGEDDFEDDYDYDDDEEEEAVENITELPNVPTHAHRHHHGDAENKPELTSNSFELGKDINKEEEEEEVVDKSLEQKTLNLNSNIRIDDEIDESVSQLESVITKTIENTKNIKDLPVIKEVVNVGDVVQTEDVPDTPQIVKSLDTAIVMEKFSNEILDNKFETQDNYNNNNDDLILATAIAKSISSSTVSSLIPIEHRFNVGEVTESTTTIATKDLEQLDIIVSTTTASTTISPQIVSLTPTNNILSPSQESTSSSSLASQLSPYSPYDASSASISSVVGAFTTISPDIPIAITIMQPPHYTVYDESKYQKIDLDENDDEIDTTNSTIKSIVVPSNSDVTTTSSIQSNLHDDNLSNEMATMPAFTTKVYNESQPSSVENNQETNINYAVTTATSNLYPEDNNNLLPFSNLSAFSSSSTPSSISTSTAPITISTTHTPVPAITSSSSSTTYASTDYVEPKIENMPPMIKTRLQKFAVTSGKSFRFIIPEDTFIDNEDNTNLRLELTDKDGHELKQSSWLQFNTAERELYGLPLDDTVSKWEYRLTATDSGNESVTETLEISVQQHRGVRTVNHEINIAVKINEKGMNNIDWQLKLMKAIANTLGDNTVNSIVVREIRQNVQELHAATFVYFNETLPTTECPEANLNYLIKSLDATRLSELVKPALGIKSITGSLIGSCQKTHGTKPKQTTHVTKNWPPMPRNQVDRVNATVGHLLVFKVPSDTFYDPNDNELKLILKTKENKDLNPRHWLQFDSKNQEFFGIPKSGDIGSEEYLLVAEDSGGLSATDALVVVVSHAPKKEFSAFFKAFLAIRHEQFTADLQRKFVERILALHGDHGTNHIQIRSVTTHHDSDGTIVNFFNTTLYKTHNRCPEKEIEATRSVYLQDYLLRDRVKKALGPELNLTNLSVISLGSCHPQTDVTHREFIPTKTDEPLLKSTFSEEYMTTIILPAIVIITMVLVALIIACCLHRRRVKSGKMELGDEEERKSFHTKGIPVIFQDELDEKPETGNKSPIILKDEKPPLLPPSYNTSNINGDNDVDEYVPPPAVIVGGREVRGKSPATPSYRKPPPYVSP